MSDPEVQPGAHQSVLSFNCAGHIYQARHIYRAGHIHHAEHTYFAEQTYFAGRTYYTKHFYCADNPRSAHGHRKPQLVYICLSSH